MPQVDKPPSSTGILHQTVVVFSRDYLPVARINIKRAIALLVMGQAECLDFGARTFNVRSPGMTLAVSEHIRLTKGNPSRRWRVPAVSRREVFRRDDHKCQYCGSSRKLTIDHVIPRSKGGSHTWDNVVAACAPCNHAKGDRLLKHTTMSLKATPKTPLNPVVAFAEQFWQSQPDLIG